MTSTRVSDDMERSDNVMTRRAVTVMLRYAMLKVVQVTLMALATYVYRRKEVLLHPRPSTRRIRQLLVVVTRRSSHHSMTTRRPRPQPSPPLPQVFTTDFRVLLIGGFLVYEFFK